MTAITGPVKRIEWGLQLNCEKNGCDPKHSDDGRVMTFEPWERRPTEAHPVNGHATRLVTRTVTYEPWQEAYVTKTGTVLTETDIEALADEAEAGYGVSAVGWHCPRQQPGERAHRVKWSGADPWCLTCNEPAEYKR